MKRLAEKPDLAVKVYSRQKVLFDSFAYSLSAVNKLGPLDILPGHANIISILQECSIVIDSPEGDTEMTINKGLLKVSANSVVVFVDI